MTAPTAVGVDIGGTTSAAVLVDPDGTVLARAGAQTPARSGAEAVLDVARHLVAQVDPEGRAAHLGAGVAGVVLDGRVVAATDAVAGWTGADVAAALGRHRPGGRDGVLVLNDVHAFAEGERRVGAAAGARDVVAVTVGTGVGGAVVADGRLLKGRRGAAGHLGHVPAAAAGREPCPCGASGHVEAVVGAEVLRRAYEEATGTAVTDLAQVSARAAAGDEVALAVLGGAGDCLGTVLAGVVAVCAPDVVVVGGGVARAGEPFLGPLRAALRREAHPVVADVQVLAAALGDDAVAVGAALAALAAPAASSDSAAPAASSDSASRGADGRAVR